MKTHSNNFKEQIKQLGREIDSKVTYELNGETIELGAEELNSITPSFKGGYSLNKDSNSSSCNSACPRSLSNNCIGCAI